jgi:Ser/Thr protein kinase RdoA (MazF antagonist)
MSSPSQILPAFGLHSGQYKISSITSGYINHTYKIEGKPQSYVLQRINKNVFKQPEVIASNLHHAATFLKHHHPDYLFLESQKTADGKEMLYDEDGFPWRLFLFIEKTMTVNHVDDEHQAFEAAKGFGRLARNLSGCNVHQFRPTIDRFHDLSLRYQQFETAVANASRDRLEEASEQVKACQDFSHLVKEYESLIDTGAMPLRVMHNDTKISNILFDTTTGKSVCVIDLDTLMPGYFIYDLGDMIRTFVSPVDEEEKDLQKVIVREEVYDALVKGYLQEMEEVLTPGEKSAVSFSGKMMTYIMALRMLADYLNGDIYYVTTYPKQNLIRARNQLELLKKLFVHS